MRQASPAVLARYAHGQRGQTLVFGVLAAGAAGVVLVMLYNVGQIALARSRLTQATDAAAYSAALMQARTLNMLAHVQRTQVGHQVAMAHLVTLGAWAQFSDKEHASHRRGNPPGMIINRFFGPLHGQAYAQAGAMSADTRGALTQAMAGHDRAAHQVLAGVARHLVDGLPAVRAATIDQVLSANLPGQAGKGPEGQAPSVQWRITDDTWGDLLVRHSSREPGHSDPLAQLVRRAVQPYAFLRKRNHSTYSPWSIHPACPLMLHILQRRGATWMDDSGRWQALDTQAFHARRFNRFIGCYYREYIMGNGAVRGDRSNPDGLTEDDLPDLSRESFWRWVRRATRWNLTFAESRWAAMAAMFDAWAPPQRGLPPWFDIRQKDAATAGFVLEVQQDMSAVPTSDRADSPFGAIGRFAFAGLGRAARMVVRAAGQTYFSPEDRGEGGSTFRPQWRARLAPVRREGGQALLESLMVMALLLVFAGAALDMGRRFHVNVQNDLTSRWLAFTVPPELSGIVQKDVSQVQGVAGRAARLRTEPGGQGPGANEMRAAWHYADQGLVQVRVGTRSTAVARDAGHHHDHRATQRRLGLSQTAWAGVAQASQRVGKRIQVQAGRSDVGWRRAQPSFDWLEPWAGIDLRPARRPRLRRSVRRRGRTVSRSRRDRRDSFGHPMQTGAQGTISRVGRLRRSVLRQLRAMRLALCLPLLLGITPGVAAQCSVPGLSHKNVFESVVQSSRLWGELKQLRHALAHVAAGDHTEATRAFFWFGIPVAIRQFSFNASSPFLKAKGPIPGLSVAARLTTAQPLLRDFSVVDDVFLLSGHAGNTQWLAQWQESDIHVAGVLSTMRMGVPLFEARAPRWMGAQAYPTLHMVFPGDDAGHQASADRRPLDGRASTDLRWSSMSVWHSALHADVLSKRMADAFAQRGWRHVAGLVPGGASWQRERCLIDVRVGFEAGHSGATGTRIWMQSREEA